MLLCCRVQSLFPLILFNPATTAIAFWNCKVKPRKDCFLITPCLACDVEIRKIYSASFQSMVDISKSSPLSLALTRYRNIDTYNVTTLSKRPVRLLSRDHKSPPSYRIGGRGQNQFVLRGDANALHDFLADTDCAIVLLWTPPSEDSEYLTVGWVPPHKVNGSIQLAARCDHHDDGVNGKYFLMSFYGCACW